MTSAVTVLINPGRITCIWGALLHPETWICEEGTGTLFQARSHAKTHTTHWYYCSLDVKHLEIINVWMKVLPVTDKVTPGEPEYFPSGWFVMNLNLYSAESLCLRSVILRVQSFLEQLYCTRSEYCETVLRSTDVCPSTQNVSITVVSRLFILYGYL